MSFTNEAIFVAVTEAITNAFAERVVEYAAYEVTNYNVIDFAKVDETEDADLYRCKLEVIDSGTAYAAPALHQSVIDQLLKDRERDIENPRIRVQVSRSIKRGVQIDVSINKETGKGQFLPKTLVFTDDDPNNIEYNVLEWFVGSVSRRRRGLETDPTVDKAIREAIVEASSNLISPATFDNARFKVDQYLEKNDVDKSRFETALTNLYHLHADTKTVFAQTQQLERKFVIGDQYRDTLAKVLNHEETEELSDDEIFLQEVIKDGYDPTTVSQIVYGLELYDQLKQLQKRITTAQASLQRVYTIDIRRAVGKTVQTTLAHIAEQVDLALLCTDTYFNELNEAKLKDSYDAHLANAKTIISKLDLLLKYNMNAVKELRLFHNA